MRVLCPLRRVLHPPRSQTCRHWHQLALLAGVGGCLPRATGSSSKPGRSDSPLPPKGYKVPLDEKMDVSIPLSYEDLPLSRSGSVSSASCEAAADVKVTHCSGDPKPRKEVGRGLAVPTQTSYTCDAIERLMQKRTVLRSQVTRLISDIHAAIASHSDERSLNVLSVRLSELRTQLSKVNASIEPLVPDRDDDKIVTYIVTIAQEVEELRRARPQAGTTRIHNDGDGHVATSKVKLPKLELQRFGGAATDWQPFWEQYKQAIHDNDSLSNAEKFLYLRSALTGKAASAIASIQATGENYDTVVELLRKRFGRTDVLIQEHLSQLLDLPAVRHSSEVSGLRRLYDHLQRNIAASAVN
ncbi:hypothetical protein HPB47_014271 [Ixodes persulcatus]|uniref:Uncharacterized protein n=1 Tax=Ixodes persulcatus TaxID=34615 RepID=A0AC60QWD6_IXOPE|nr:hypothetical protein HPB47_014271 [Ixodes persulcatus]